MVVNQTNLGENDLEYVCVCIYLCMYVYVNVSVFVSVCVCVCLILPHPPRPPRPYLSLCFYPLPIHRAVEHVPISFYARFLINDARYDLHSRLVQTLEQFLDHALQVRREQDCDRLRELWLELRMCIIINIY